MSALALALGAGGDVPQLAPGASVALDFVGGRFRNAAQSTTAFTSLTGATFSNSTGGYVQRASGLLVPVAANTPRISDLGLLIEGGGTNLALQSQNMASASWNKNAGGVASAPSVTANFAAAPDGTQTASRVQYALNGGTTSTDRSWLTQTVATSAVASVLSIYVKSNTAASYSMIWRDANSAAQVAITVTPTWQRVTLPFTPGASTIINLEVRGGQAPTNSDSADVLVWGAQLEQASFVSSYIATTTAAASRSADNASLAVTVPTEGIFACAYFQPVMPPSTRAEAWCILDGGSNRLALRAQDASTTNPRLLLDNTTSQTVTGGSAPASGALVKTAGAFSSLSAKAALAENGAAPITQAFQANAAVTGAQTLFIGGTGAGAVPLQGYIENLFIYPIYDQGSFLQGLAS